MHNLEKPWKIEPKPEEAPIPMPINLEGMLWKVFKLGMLTGFLVSAVLGLVLYVLMHLS